MYRSNLSKDEIIKRIVEERDMYLHNAESCIKDHNNNLADQYKNRADDISRLMKVLEISDK